MASARTHPRVRHVVRPLDEELAPAVRGVPNVQNLLRLQLVVQGICTKAKVISSSLVAVVAPWPQVLAQ